MVVCPKCGTVWEKTVKIKTNQCLQCRKKYHRDWRGIQSGRPVIEIPESIRWHRDWPDYGGDDEGNVYSSRHKNHPRLIKPGMKKGGYLQFTATKDGTTSVLTVHRFILELFVGPCPPGMEACHGKEGPSINALRNLRWDTRQENHRDIHRHGRKRGAQKLTLKEAREIKHLCASGMKQNAVAVKFRTTPNNVNSIVHGHSWKILDTLPKP